MYVVIPHVGKSHLTYRLCQSIPDKHKIVLVDGSYVQDMGTLAFNRKEQITYIPTNGKPHCLAKNQRFCRPERVSQWAGASRAMPQRRRR